MPPARRRSVLVATAAGTILLLWRGPVRAQDFAPECHSGSGGTPIVATPSWGAGLAPADPYGELLQPVTRLVPATGYYMDLDLHGDVLAAARVSPGGGGVDFFDVGDPRKAVLLAAIQIQFPVWDVSMFEQGGILYVALGNETVFFPQVGAHIWALTPAGPVYASNPSHLGVPENVHHVFVESRGGKRFLYAGASFGPFAAIDGHIDVYDVTVPWVPVYLTTLGPPGGPTPPFFAHDFHAGWNASLGRHVLTVGALTQGVFLIDVEEPQAPVFLSQFSSYGPSVDGHSMALSADGGRVYLTNEIPNPAWGGLNVLDVSGAAGGGGIVEVAQYASATSFVHYARRLGSFLFTANAQDGVTLFDVSDPSDLRLLGWKATDEGGSVALCWDVLPMVKAPGTFLVANEIGEGLEIFSFRPYRPERSGGTAVHLGSLGLAVRNWTDAPATVVGSAFLKGQGGTLSYSAPLSLVPYGITPFPIPPSAGALPNGSYEVVFEVVQKEGTATTYLDRLKQKVVLF
ncbi:MAG: hypothetical protein L0323_16960 [Planctomycetes bacterium]|nr:hypothetical protein [Planctomycetota bacterium]